MSELGVCEVRRMKLTKLIPAEYNPRSITSKAFAGLGVSLIRFGLMEPIIWNQQTGNMVGGHQRYRHLVEQGEEDTDVIVVDLDGQKEVALNLALNSKHLRGKFTEDAVAQLKMVEARLGNAFAELGLLDLHNALEKQIARIKERRKGSSGGEPPSEMVEPEAVVTCPKCKSRWQMKDNRVLTDKGQSE